MLGSREHVGCSKHVVCSPCAEKQATCMPRWAGDCSCRAMLTGKPFVKEVTFRSCSKEHLSFMHDDMTRHTLQTVCQRGISFLEFEEPPHQLEGDFIDFTGSFCAASKFIASHRQVSQRWLFWQQCSPALRRREASLTMTMATVAEAHWINLAPGEMAGSLW